MFHKIPYKIFVHYSLLSFSIDYIDPGLILYVTHYGNIPPINLIRSLDSAYHLISVFFLAIPNIPKSKIPLAKYILYLKEMQWITPAAPIADPIPISHKIPHIFLSFLLTKAQLQILKYCKSCSCCKAAQLNYNKRFCSNGIRIRLVW